jgi:exopolysaccharide/PEP-CTERM locus tyrosine autokinase
MSLVEKALKKMQEASRAAPPPAPPVPPPPRPHTDAVAVSHISDTASHRVVPRRRVVNINVPALRAAGLFPPEYQERPIAQQYRQIKRPLVANALGRSVPQLPNGHLIMLASAMPGEGKTFTSINLAFSMSIEKDINVLLVDADVAKPHISRLLGVQDEPGLLDVLRDPTLDVESVILPTDVPNLSLLPAGTRSEQATELLTSARMAQVVHAIGERDEKRIALFDSPPLLLTTESHALTHAVGQVVVVVRAAVTSQQMLMDALSYLGERSGVSLVLNQSVASSPSGYHYYGYGEQRTTGYGEERAAQSGAPPA